MPAREACRWDWMAGLATATIVPSMPTIITPSATASSVRPGLPRQRPAVPPGPVAGASPAVLPVAFVFVLIRSSVSGARCRAPVRSEFAASGDRRSRGASGPLPALEEEGGARPERDDAHARRDLRAVNDVAVEVQAVPGGAGRHRDREVEQEQEPQHRPRRGPRLLLGGGGLVRHGNSCGSGREACPAVGRTSACLTQATTYRLPVSSNLNY